MTAIPAIVTIMIVANMNMNLMALNRSHSEYQAPLLLPDRNYTYGVVDPEATVEKICTSGYTDLVRNVSSKIKTETFRDYDLNPKEDDYEFDHLIPLELGGSNDRKNLWPQSYNAYLWNARTKDKLENKMHKLVCEGKLDLPTAQFEIATDWVKAYQKYVGVR